MNDRSNDFLDKPEGVDPIPSIVSGERPAEDAYRNAQLPVHRPERASVFIPPQLRFRADKAEPSGDHTARAGLDIH